MLQFKIFTSTDPNEVEKSVNDFLAELDKVGRRAVKVNNEHSLAATETVPRRRHQHTVTIWHVEKTSPIKWSN